MRRRLTQVRVRVSVRVRVRVNLRLERVSLRAPSSSSLSCPARLPPWANNLSKQFVYMVQGLPSQSNLARRFATIRVGRWEVKREMICLKVVLDVNGDHCAYYFRHGPSSSSLSCAAQLPPWASPWRLESQPRRSQVHCAASLAPLVLRVQSDRSLLHVIHHGLRWGWRSWLALDCCLSLKWAQNKIKKLCVTTWKFPAQHQQWKRCRISTLAGLVMNARTVTRMPRHANVSCVRLYD